MNKKIVIPLLVLIFSLGAFFRLAYNTKIYTEGDDAGIIGLYKSNAPDHDFKLLGDDIIDINIRVKAEGIKAKLLDSWLFPFFVGYVYTYPPGQFMFYPLFLSESDDYAAKLSKGRAIAGVLNFAALPLLLYLLYLLNGKKWDDNFLLPLAVLAFSFNSILYAHNNSPYAFISASYLIALILLVKVLSGNLRLTGFFALLAALTYFNYLIILFLPLFFLMIIWQKRIFRPREIIRSFFLPGLAYLLIFLPGYILFFKGGAGFCCTPPPDWSIGNLLKIIAFLPAQFINALSSATAFFTAIDPINIVFTASFVVSAIILSIKDYRSGQKGLLWRFVLLGFIFWLEWIFLYSLKKISMDRTRHILSWLPMFAVLLYYVLAKAEIIIKEYGFKYYKNIYFVVVLLLAVSGSIMNYKILHAKFNLTDYELIRNQGLSTIVSYNALDSALFLSLPEMAVYNVESPYFKYSEQELPAEFLMYSQEVPLSRFLSQIYKPQAEENMKAILADYDHISIVEKASDNYFYYDNSPIASVPNNFYLYKFTRKKQ